MMQVQKGVQYFFKLLFHTIDLHIKKNLNTQNISDKKWCSNQNLN